MDNNTNQPAVEKKRLSRRTSRKSACKMCWNMPNRLRWYLQ